MRIQWTKFEKKAGLRTLEDLELVLGGGSPFI